MVVSISKINGHKNTLKIKNSKHLNHNKSIKVQYKNVKQDYINFGQKQTLLKSFSKARNAVILAIGSFLLGIETLINAFKNKLFDTEDKRKLELEADIKSIKSIIDKKQVVGKLDNLKNVSTADLLRLQVLKAHEFAKKNPNINFDYTAPIKTLNNEDFWQFNFIDFFLRMRKDKNIRPNGYSIPSDLKKSYRAFYEKRPIETAELCKVGYYLKRGEEAANFVAFRNLGEKNNEENFKIHSELMRRRETLYMFIKSITNYTQKDSEPWIHSILNNFCNGDADKYKQFFDNLVERGNKH